MVRRVGKVLTVCLVMLTVTLSVSGRLIAGLYEADWFQMYVPQGYVLVIYGEDTTCSICQIHSCDPLQVAREENASGRVRIRYYDAANPEDARVLEEEILAQLRSRPEYREVSVPIVVVTNGSFAYFTQGDYLDLEEDLRWCIRSLLEQTVARPAPSLFSLIWAAALLGMNPCLIALSIFVGASAGLRTGAARGVTAVIVALIGTFLIMLGVAYATYWLLPRRISQTVASICAIVAGVWFLLSIPFPQVLMWPRRARFWIIRRVRRGGFVELLLAGLVLALVKAPCFAATTLAVTAWFVVAFRTTAPVIFAMGMLSVLPPLIIGFAAAIVSVQLKREALMPWLQLVVKAGVGLALFAFGGMLLHSILTAE